MKRLWLILLLMLGCAHAPPMNCPSCYTIRQPFMGPFEFLHLAEMRVQQEFPEWYQKGIKIVMNLDKEGAGYGFTKVSPDGTLEIHLNAPAWDLCTVEDMSLTLLHEFVHISIWWKLQDSIPDLSCRSAVHELIAYGVELEQNRIRPTWSTRRNAEYGYLDHYVRATVYCPEGIVALFPEPTIRLED